MALETGTYISDLVATNPTSGDPKSQGDDHLRLIKSTVKATFPNVSGAVTPTHTELNYVDGVTSAIQTQLDRATLTSGTAVTASGTTVDFTSIPSWVKRITVMLDGVSFSGTDSLILQIGDSSGIQNIAYAATNGSVANGALPTVAERTDGWAIQSNAANGAFTGMVTLALLRSSSNTWVGSGNVARGGGNNNIFVVAGSKSLASTLDRIRLCASGSNNFDSGIVNILYE